MPERSATAVTLIVDAELAAQVLLLRDELRGELAADLAESEERELRLAAGGVGERMQLVELILAVQRLQRARGVCLGDGDGDVQLRRALGDGDDVDAARR